MTAMDSTTDLKAIQKESFAQDRMEIDPEYVAMLPTELFTIRKPDTLDVDQVST